jgi:hypothetical protein
MQKQIHVPTKSSNYYAFSMRAMISSTLVFKVSAVTQIYNFLTQCESLFDKKIHTFVKLIKIIFLTYICPFIVFLWFS